MSKALEVLEALSEWYEKSDTGPTAGSLLFEDDRTLKEHIIAAINCDDPSHCIDARCRMSGACQGWPSKTRKAPSC